MNQGIVKWFSDEKGYGFIKGEDGKDIYVHQTAIQVNGFRSLTEGEKVSYEVEEGDRGPKAIKVEKLGE